MKIGIIVHSFSNNTYSIAEKLREKLLEKGHTVGLERLKVAGGEDVNNRNIRLEALPDLSTYDVLVFGAPVRAFSLTPAMKEYVKQIKDISGKKVICYVTKQLPFNWTGGYQAIKSMVSGFSSKGGKVAGTAIARMNVKQRDDSIDSAVAELTRLLG